MATLFSPARLAPRRKIHLRLTSREICCGLSETADPSAPVGMTKGRVVVRRGRLLKERAIASFQWRSVAGIPGLKCETWGTLRVFTRLSGWFRRSVPRPHPLQNRRQRVPEPGVRTDVCRCLLSGRGRRAFPLRPHGLARRPGCDQASAPSRAGER